jgi:hypothetical protein
MAISSVTNRVEYQGNGTSAVFAFPYAFQSQSDLKVFAYNSSLFNSSLTTQTFISPLTLNGSGPYGFTISANANASGVYPNGGNIVFNSSPNIQTAVVIFRSSAVTNDFSVSQTGTIPSSSLNNQVDKLTMIAQRQQEQVTRAVRLPDGLVGAFNPTLPEDISARPNQFLAVSSSGLGFVVASVAATVALNSTFSTAQINSGYLAIGNGGTGGGGPYTQFGVVFMSSATQMASSGSAGQDVPLTGSAGGPPSFKPINLASGSSVANVLPLTLGGTGAASAAAALQAFLPAQSSKVGFALVTNGSSVAWQSMTATQTIITTLGANTYTTPTNCRAIIVQVVGAGGGGGGTAGGSNAGAGAGGGAGGYAQKIYLSGVNLDPTFAYTLGSGGPGGSAGNNAGQNGSSTVFGSMTAAGGSGGSGSAGGSAGVVFATGVANGGAGSGGDINSSGTIGKPGLILSASQALGGEGGSLSPYGQGGAGGQGTGAGTVATGFGGGGGGGGSVSGGAATAGGNGTKGVIIVTEFY